MSSEIRKVREALLAQHFEDVDQLADKISDAATKIERATATLTALNGTPRAASPKPAAAPARAAPQPQASWGKRGMWAAAVVAGLAVSAGIGALVGRSQPLQTPEQAQASDLGRGLVQAWPKLDNATQNALYRALDAQAQNSLITALKH
ncbi:hypothetical protein PP724_22845 [Ralstonia solanacearum]|uniref:hypothetical protein n=1 Tax=Ralstonia solanacearum TaxID=305 RepID=UPI001FF9F198|nr:hypothetical protein [Ralstonia solanacearum]MDC6237005.1 hypothetical protein [Ralstonia solanacearum]MDD7810562.1 hypothetical protein [Ralstonia solanacearum]